MPDSNEKWSWMYPSDDLSQMHAELRRHLLEGLMPGRLDERLLLAIWRSLYSSVRSEDAYFGERDRSFRPIVTAHHGAT